MRDSFAVMRLFLLPILLFGACGSRKEGTMKLTLSAFPDGGRVPVVYTGDGADHSPAMAWVGAPQGTRAFAVVMDDPDAPGGTWVHWVLYDLPAETAALPEGAPQPPLPPGARRGKSSWGRLGWNGPSPPPGKAHRYFFRLYALSAPTGLGTGATAAELERAMKGKVLAEARWMGTYGR